MTHHGAGFTLYSWLSICIWCSSAVPSRRSMSSCGHWQYLHMPLQAKVKLAEQGRFPRSNTAGACPYLGVCHPDT